MEIFRDRRDRKLRLTNERRKHIERAHPEMRGQTEKIRVTLEEPELVVESRVDEQTELVYRQFGSTPVTEKYLCVVVQAASESPFIVTAYFTDSVKAGEVLWEK